MLRRHWKAEESLARKAGMRNIRNFKEKKVLTTISIKNKELMPEWGDEKTEIMLEGFAEDTSNADCAIETDNGDFNFLSIEKGGIRINNFERVLQNVVYEMYYSQKRPLHSKLPIDYTRVPVKLRNFLFNVLLKFKKDPKWPNWPIEKSVELVRHLYIKSIALKLKKMCLMYLSGRKRRNLHSQ